MGGVVVYGVQSRRWRETHDYIPFTDQQLYELALVYKPYTMYSSVLI